MEEQQQHGGVSQTESSPSDVELSSCVHLPHALQGCIVISSLQQQERGTLCRWPHRPSSGAGHADGRREEHVPGQQARGDLRSPIAGYGAGLCCRHAVQLLRLLALTPTSFADSHKVLCGGSSLVLWSADGQERQSKYTGHPVRGGPSGSLCCCLLLIFNCGV